MMTSEPVSDRSTSASNPEDHLRFRRGERGLGDVHELEHELDEQHEQRERQAEVERR